LIGVITAVTEKQKAEMAVVVVFFVRGWRAGAGGEG